MRCRLPLWSQFWKVRCTAIGEIPSRCAWRARCMVHGHGAWARCMGVCAGVRGHRARCLVPGAWCTVHGARCMVHGAWCVVRGACRCMKKTWPEGQRWVGSRPRRRLPSYTATSCAWDTYGGRLGYKRLQPGTHTVAAWDACGCRLVCIRLQPGMHAVGARAPGSCCLRWAAAA